MVRRVSTGLFVAGVLAILFVCGCGQEADLSLKFTPDTTSGYKVVTENHTIFKFDMPSSDNYNEEVSEVTTEVSFDQEILNVDEKGVATAKITIKGVRLVNIDKGNKKLFYDSNPDVDSSDMLDRLIGASYTISIDPMGKVAVVDAVKARNTIKIGDASTIASNLLTNNAIMGRHQVVTLAQLESPKKNVGDSWSVIETPKQRLLVPRTFEKVYTLDKIRKEDNVAVVSMEAIPAEDAASLGNVNPALLMFGPMMDPEESYTGKMELDINSGQVLDHEETLDVVYIVTDQKESGDPDMLTITLTYTSKAEKLY